MLDLFKFTLKIYIGNLLYPAMRNCRTRTAAFIWSCIDAWFINPIVVLLTFRQRLVTRPRLWLRWAVNYQLVCRRPETQATPVRCRWPVFSRSGVWERRRGWWGWLLRRRWVRWRILVWIRPKGIGTSLCHWRGFGAYSTSVKRKHYD